MRGRRMLVGVPPAFGSYETNGATSVLSAVPSVSTVFELRAPAAEDDHSPRQPRVHLDLEPVNVFCRRLVLVMLLRYKSHCLSRRSRNIFFSPSCSFTEPSPGVSARP